jgi:hypothetical protein
MSYLVGLNLETCPSDPGACDWHAPYIFQMVPGLVTVLRRALLPGEARNLYWFRLEEGDPLLRDAMNRREAENRYDPGELSFHRDDILWRHDVYDPTTGAVDMA